MIPYDVLDRFDGSVKFTAEIDCDENESRSVKLGLAVKWAVKNGATLKGARLDYARLDGASLDYASLDYASLDYASLDYATLKGASLDRASLDGASLNHARLDRASLYGAILYGARLDYARLDGASLDYASLDYASLDGASLDYASLYGAILYGVSGVNDWIKCIQIDQYPITYTSDVIQIGCQSHLISEWAEFDDRRIAEMDGKDAIKFWRKYKEWIFRTIELCPARPTGAEKTQ